MKPVPLLHDLLLDSARRLPEKEALVAGDRRVTYADLDARSNALAHGLERSGVVRGDRVIVFMESSVEAVVSFWAVLKANAVVVMVHPHTKAEKLTYLLRDSDARVLLTEAQLASVFTVAARQSTHLATVVVSGRFDPARHMWTEQAVAWADFVGPGRTDHPPARLNIDIDLAAIIYTSGSTGQAKGVMLTHRNMMTASTSITSYLQNTEDDVILGCLPLSFDYGLYQMIMAFHLGARLVLEKSFAYPAEVLQTIIRERVTGLPGVPTLFAMLGAMKSLRDLNLRSIRYVTNTAAALPVQQVLLLQQLFPDARIYSMYGLTECKRCTYLPPEDLGRKPTSVGIAIPNTELWLVDDHDRRVGPNVVGQLVIRGATVMAGYWRKPEETAKKLRPGPIPGEHVLYTGDLCRVDEEGYLTFVGRMDDIIKSRGEKVAPKEIEAFLYSLPGVTECAVIGVPDDLLGQAPKAFVVFAEGQALDGRQLKQLCQGHLESFMVPKYFEVRTELPKSDNGKIDKKVLT